MTVPYTSAVDVLLLLTREPVNAEPHKCAGLRWAPLDALPTDTVPYTALGVDLYRRRAPFGLAGW